MNAPGGKIKVNFLLFELFFQMHCTSKAQTQVHIDWIEQGWNPGPLRFEPTILNKFNWSLMMGQVEEFSVYYV